MKRDNISYRYTADINALTKSVSLADNLALLLTKAQYRLQQLVYVTSSDEKQNNKIKLMA